MQFSKSTFLPILGLVVLIFFVGMAYLNNHIFLDKLVLCSFILGLVFFTKMRGESNETKSNSDSTN
ncbi:hypothetical protein V8G56_00015 [Gaetbulibacter aquiaggeris]|uniref:Uncharacterized protein n=1 Tax=Gaetbulibacter aquiaggeris TaxID=1735373 RepID=A0ABW7MJV0_9FLAO